MSSADYCPCDSGRGYADCCQPLLEGRLQAATAEALMRSRYTAYVKGDADYLHRTWHASTRPAQLDLQAGQPHQWRGLKILRTELGGQTDQHGSVEFVARYKVNGRAGRLHELSQFVQEDGRWFYVSGELSD